MMRLLVALQLFCISALSFGQDIILTKDAEEIDAKVLTISETEIGYQLKGQTVRRTIGIDKVFMIRYANGEKEVFKSDTPSEAVQSKQNPVRSDDGLPRASRAYKLFDLYDENGVRGIVIEISDGGYHGKIISLDETKCAFMNNGSLVDMELGLNDKYDGRENMKRVFAYLDKSKLLTIDNFPAIQWCMKQGKGWYLPAHEEMARLFWTYFLKDNSLDWLNNALETYGGKKIKAGEYEPYATSTEAGTSTATSGYGLFSETVEYVRMYATWFHESDDGENCISRYIVIRVRAFHRF